MNPSIFILNHLKDFLPILQTTNGRKKVYVFIMSMKIPVSSEKQQGSFYFKMLGVNAV